MNISKNHLLLTAVASSLLLGASAAGADTAKLVKECNECHGKDGNSTDSKVPSIAGFSTDSVNDMMMEFKEGDRKGLKYTPENGDETDMNKIAEQLSDADIKAVSDYYAGKKFIPHKQDFDAKLAKKGKKVHDKLCEKCHSDGGSNGDDDSAILAGQWRDYLEKQFDLVEAGERKIPRKMKKKFKKIKDGQHEQLIEYYVSQQ